MEKSRLKVMALAIAMVLFSVAGAFAQSGNLLTNGDAGKSTTGWVDPDNAWSAVSAQWNRPGKMFWPARKKTGGSRMYQDVAIGSGEGRTATLSAFAHGYGTDKDKALLRLEFLSAGGSVIDSSESDYVSGERDKNAWRKISISRTVPAGAVTARISLVGINGHNTTSDCDSYFADVVFTVSGSVSSAKPAPSGNSGTSSTVSLICTMEPGDSVKFSLPGASSTTWTSSDDSVATVSKKGKVKAVDEGTAIITASSGSVTMRIQVEVEE